MTPVQALDHDEANKSCRKQLRDEQDWRAQRSANKSQSDVGSSDDTCEKASATDEQESLIPMGLTLGRIDVRVKLFACVRGPFSCERRGEARPANESAERSARNNEQVRSRAGHSERGRLVRLRVVSALFGQDQKGSKDACLEEETD